MDLIIPILPPSPRFIASFYSSTKSENKILEYFYCNHLVYEKLDPKYYKGYSVYPYKQDDPITPEENTIFKACDPNINRVNCKNIINKFYNFTIIYPKSALFDYWGIKTNYEIEDFDEYHYYPIDRKI